MPIANGLSLPNPLSNGTTADAVQVMGDFNYLLAALNRALLDAGGGAGMNAVNTQIHNLANGSAANDAVNLSQLGAYALLAGATFTGGLLGTTLGLSSTLSVAGASTLAALTASGLITGNAGFSGTTMALSSTLAVGNVISAASYVTLTVNGTALQFTDLSGTHPYFGCQNDNNFVFVSTDVNGNPRPIWNIFQHSSTSVFNINPAVTLQSTLTATGLITGNAGFSGTTLNLSSTLSVTGASTLAALTASGLITGNAGFSGTTLSLSGQATLGNVTGTPNGTAVNGLGYLGAPQNLHTTSYTCVLSDAGVSQDFNGASLTATIPANASVAYPIGTIIPFSNINASNLTIAITTDTMTLAGTTTTGNRTLAQNGVATARKMTATTWLIWGAGLS